MKPELVERRSDSLNEILVRLGKSEKGIEILETEKYANQQAIVNSRAEMQGYVDKVEERVLAVVKPLVTDVNAIKRFMYTALGGGGTVMFLLEAYRTFK